MRQAAAPEPQPPRQRSWACRSTCAWNARSYWSGRTRSRNCRSSPAYLTGTAGERVTTLICVAVALLLSRSRTWRARRRKNSAARWDSRT